MRIKNKKSWLFILVFVLSFFALNGFGQSWVKSDDGRPYSLHHLFFHTVKAFFKGVDSQYYALTIHQPDSYWEKKNENKSELLVSTISKNGEPRLIRKLDAYVYKPTVRVFNNKYYVLDNDPKQSKKKYYYACYVYNADWQLESTINIAQIPHQRGFFDLAVNKEGEFFLLTSPYFIDHRPEDFKGAYLVKYSANGEMLKQVLFDKSYAPTLRMAGEKILFQLHHQKLLGQSFYQTDSLFDVVSDRDLNYSIVAASPFIPRDRKIKEDVLLSDGERVIYIDSSYALSANSSTSDFKIALLDKEGSRKWTFEPSERWLVDGPKPLENGGFIAKIDKRWDSTCLVVFDKQGKQRSIRSFLMNADTRIDRYSFIDFFEVSKNELWVFYKKETPQREQELYFERILF